MENIILNKNKLIISILGLIFVIVILFLLTQQRHDKKYPVVNITSDTEEDIESNLGITEKTSTSVDIKKEPAGALTTPEYKELLKKGHNFYVKGDYENALEIFKQALKIEQNDRVYMSIFSTYLAMGNYSEAEKAIKFSIALNKRIPSNWIDYASFEALYMNASPEVVSTIYLDGLAATGNNIDIITNYSAYLSGMKNYEEAIKLLERAKVINPARSEVFQSEIDYLKSKLN